MTRWDDFCSGTVTASGDAHTTFAAMTYAAPHRCCIGIVRRAGNQHVQHQYGECCCGKRYTRTIHWGRHNETEWRERP